MKTAHQLGSTFGAGREAFDKVVSHGPNGHNYQPHERGLPGPGWYKAKNDNNKNLSFSMRRRTQKECKSVHTYERFCSISSYS